jgi:hypothetical protein
MSNSCADCPATGGGTSEKAYLIQLGLGFRIFCSRIHRGAAEYPGFKIKNREIMLLFCNKNCNPAFAQVNSLLWCCLIATRVAFKQHWRAETRTPI